MTGKLADAFVRIVGPGARVRFEAYDGSAAGPEDAPTRIKVMSPRALRMVASAPGDLGLARAYVSGEMQIEGDLHAALKELSPASPGGVTWRDRLDVARAIGVRGLASPGRPAEEVHLRGRRHSKRRDAEAIAHHYDVSNRFYEWVLGPSMAYTCAVYPREDATLEEAQFEKFDLVCRKLGLEPGMRLLDVGCGWGGMVLHAVQHYGVTAIGVTLSRAQAEWGTQAIKEARLDDRAEVRFQDYRDVAESDFDAVSSIGLTEHIGKEQLRSYFRFLYSKLKAKGRLLNHCITRPTTTAPATKLRGFINRYVFPDGELLGIGHITSVMQDNGFEIRHVEDLREHYAKTLTAWCDNLRDHWDEAVQEVGIGKARVWALYMAGSRLGFERNQIQLHQALGVRVSKDGDAAMPLRPAF